MAPSEVKELLKQLDYLKNHGYITEVTSPYGSDILFVPKAMLRMVVDYPIPINKLTVVDKYPLPRIDEMLDWVVDAIYFSKLDLHSGFHKIMVFPEHVKRTAFRTKYSTFVYQVMPFGPCNALRHFRRSWSIFSKTGSNSLELTSTTS